MSELWPHTGAVLAGGSGTRMGSPKGDIRLDTGLTMTETVLSALESVCVSVVVVGAEIKSRICIADKRSGLGPLGGIEALLASGIDDEYLVCPNDIPLIAPQLLVRLTAPSDSLATIFEIEGNPRTQSLPLRVSTGALSAVVGALDAGHNSIHSVLSQLSATSVPISRERAASLLNINTPGDLTGLSGSSEHDPPSQG